MSSNLTKLQDKFQKTMRMGGFHHASAGKNKKVIEISPLLAFWPERAKK